MGEQLTRKNRIYGSHMSIVAAMLIIAPPLPALDVSVLDDQQHEPWKGRGKRKKRVM